ncbi:MAG: glycosyltransferase, partial [bacterium]
MIPAYNEEKNLQDLLSRLPCRQEDVVVVDDGSSDATAEVAYGWGCVVLRQGRNMGKGAAQRAGFEYLRNK